ncbi:hypothetical protein GCM10010307_08410 [Streptomyces vastus]|uniref:Transposase n=1 Tax=Streptomyces vastus TaxID=285451 RepID=A0ABP6CSG9_9ACTN
MLNGQPRTGRGELRDKPQRARTPKNQPGTRWALGQIGVWVLLSRMTNGWAAKRSSAAPYGSADGRTRWHHQRQAGGDVLRRIRRSVRAVTTWPAGHRWRSC